jgi:hypothetical protein
VKPVRPVLATLCVVAFATAAATAAAPTSARSHHAAATGTVAHHPGAGRRGPAEASLAGDGPLVAQARPFTDDGGPLAPGQVEMTTVSTRPTLVTEHRARIAIRGLGRDDSLRVAVNGRVVTRAFHPHPSLPGQAAGEVEGTVTHLHRGANEVRATVKGKRYGTRRMWLRIVVHSMQGPVISGPHQEPFVCRTVANGLGRPHGSGCVAKPRVHWWWRDSAGNFHRLFHPYADYPTGVSTTMVNGRQVPFVVRVQNLVINRSVTRLAVLDDPHARRGHRFRPSEWNHRLVWHFGESCGTGYEQGTDGGEASVFGSLSDISSENLAGPFLGLPALLGSGYLVGESSLTIFGVHCNQVLSAETLMMIKEYLTDHYGDVDSVVGGGASGGAIQQYTIANGYPGILSAGTPLLSFPDVVTTAMTVGDCVLMQHFFNSHRGWQPDMRKAVSGLATPTVCKDWTADFGPDLLPTSCPSGVPPREIYNRRRNPHGVRCDLQDDLKNVLGTDPATGQAFRPLDNVGVQYGLRALRRGQITPARFVQLNRDIGGLDLDGRFVGRRESMTTGEARRMFRVGGVGEFGAINQTPIIDQSIPAADEVPDLDIHDQIRPYEIRARLDANFGSHASQAIWSGAALPSSAIVVAEQWLDDLAVLQARHPYESRARLVARSRPRAAADSCRTGPAGAAAPCSVGKHSGPRQVAGGPLTEDVIKCHLRPLHRGDYPRSLRRPQFRQLRRIFPNGVCDYRRHSVGWRHHARTWWSFGAQRLSRGGFVVPYPIVRSRVPHVR